MSLTGLFLAERREPQPNRLRLPLKAYRIPDSTFGALLSLPGLAMLLLWVGVPLVIVIWISFLRYDFMHPIRFYGLGNYLRLFRDRVFLLALKNTAIFSAGSTVLTFIVGFTCAWSLSRIGRGSAVFRTLVMLPWAVPLIVSGFIWGWMFNPSYGVINDILIKLGLISRPLDVFGNPDTAMIGVIIADAWTRIPFMTILTLAGLERIPRELYEAAKIDGADVFHELRRITLPLVRGPVLTGLLITTIFSMRSIDAIFSMTRGGPAKATYVLGLYNVDNIYRFLNFGRAGAISVMLMLFCFLTAGIYAYFLLKEQPWE
jgi:multiple sugar transport system permease protein